MWEGGGGRRQYRDALLKALHDGVEGCHAKFGGCTLLATESEPSVLKLIRAMELILQDQLKARPSPSVSANLRNLNVNSFSLRQVTELVSNGLSMVMGPVAAQDPPVFWNYVRQHLTHHERERYQHLQQVVTDYGRGRSWLRSTINEHSLERHLRSFSADDEAAAAYYEAGALFLDAEVRRRLQDAARRLRTVIFALGIDRRELDQVDEATKLLLASLQPEPEAVFQDRPAPPTASQSPPTNASAAAPRAPKKKSKVRVVDLLDSGVEEAAAAAAAAEAVEAPSIAIPADGGANPSLILPPSTSSSPGAAHCPAAESPASASTLSTADLRQMLLDLTAKKDDADECKAGLQSQVHGLQLEVERLQQKLLTADQQSADVGRENAILKQQLKQYMAAVQMIKSPSTQSSSDCAPTPPPLDYHREASHFEEKLVQVAEMHGELMEFNGHLQRQLRAVETLADRLRNELVLLRGPLPTDYCRDSDDVEDPSSDGVNSPSQTPRPLVHVWIPSAFLVHGASDPHHIYQVYVRIGDEEWLVYKRYSQLHHFRKQAKEAHPFVKSLAFPPKKNFGRQRDDRTVEERRKRLQDFLRQFLNHWQLQRRADEPLTRTTFVQQLPFFAP